MDFVVKDSNRQPIAVVDLYTSAIWTERYSDTGDFSLTLPVNNEYLDYLAIDNYLTLPDTDRAMIIESFDLTSEVSTGKKVVTYTGSSLESILKRRIVWVQTTMSGTILDNVRQLINENIISPDANHGGSNRAVPDFVFVEPTDREFLSFISDTIGRVSCQFTGDNLYDAIKALCDPYNIGFKICFNENDQFAFSLYYGTNRSTGQNTRDSIVFSPEFDTLISSRYAVNFAKERNVALVLGEDSGPNRKRAMVYSTDQEPSGLSRKELYVDARDIQSERENGTTMTDPEYYNCLASKGYSELNEYATTSAFDGEVETHIGPAYNRDYFLGDFVTVVNEFGLGAYAQITEYIRSYDDSGYSAYPSFAMIN